ncbi:hypothetical protein ABT341_04425 [Pseudonocardia alni]|uniref:Uncharacterized protein n=1 Tax=Pseudonocardia parietis TaxID=570936 RepID=A0ABS4VTK7_9PSEU|nr:hypothetical protein [Pseudonocardia parietis]MBP2367246.1 hypothetical protein [Pseudonocardia parietis]
MPFGPVIGRNIQGTSLLGAPATGRPEPVDIAQVIALHDPPQ